MGFHQVRSCACLHSLNLSGGPFVRYMQACPIFLGETVRSGLSLAQDCEEAAGQLANLGVVVAV